MTRKKARYQSYAAFGSARNYGIDQLKSGNYHQDTFGYLELS